LHREKNPLKISELNGEIKNYASAVHHHRWTQWCGKTTFAGEFLPKDARVMHFVNADLIAGGLSPLRPELAAVAAGRLVLKELDCLTRNREDFAFESTLSGLAYIGRLKRWKSSGYRIEIAYLRLRSPKLALRRIAARVKQGKLLGVRHAWVYEACSSPPFEIGPRHGAADSNPIPGSGVSRDLPGE
jgi:hypothetical protein